MKLTTQQPGYGTILARLPGKDRKRQPALYEYRVTYRSPDQQVGCLMTWEVTGGRDSYQIALEKTDSGDHTWHCTCADAIFRGDNDPTHRCKHVRGLADGVPTIPPSIQKRMGR